MKKERNCEMSKPKSSVAFYVRTTLLVTFFHKKKAGEGKRFIPAPSMRVQSMTAEEADTGMSRER